MFDTAYQSQATSYGNLDLPVDERIGDLHRRAARLAPRVEDSADDSGCTDHRPDPYFHPRGAKAWDMVAEALAWNALTDRSDAARSELARAEEMERRGIAYHLDHDSMSAAPVAAVADDWTPLAPVANVPATEPPADAADEIALGALRDSQHEVNRAYLAGEMNQADWEEASHTYQTEIGRLTAWPAGKAFGELTPAQRERATREAADQLQDELTASAPAIGLVLEDWERELLEPADGHDDPRDTPELDAQAFAADRAGAQRRLDAAHARAVLRRAERAVPPQPISRGQCRYCPAYCEHLADGACTDCLARWKEFPATRPVGGPLRWPWPSCSAAAPGPATRPRPCRPAAPSARAPSRWPPPSPRA